MATTARADVSGYSYGASGSGLTANPAGSGFNALEHSGNIGSFGGLSHSSGGGATYHGSQQHSEAPVQTEFTKEFYTFEAPQENNDDAQHLERIATSLKKNLQIVFIKAPENHGLEHAALSLAKSATDSRTAIYVLHKQADLSTLANNLVNVHTHNAHTPEVHFVKYRTPADAANAQHAIQSQYESLGGSSVHKNGGVAQVLNFASKYAPAYHGTGYSVGSNSGAGIGIDASGGSTGISSGVSVPSQTYLPASV